MPNACVRPSARQRHNWFSCWNVGTRPVTVFSIKGESREKTPRRLEGAKIFARLSSPCNVERLLGFSFFAKSCCCRDDAFGFWCDKQYGCKNCQPWFYLRLEAYSFFWLSEGAYSLPRDSWCSEHTLRLTRLWRLTLEPKRQKNRKAITRNESSKGRF